MKVQPIKPNLSRQTLRNASLHQPMALPREEWIQTVMTKVRQEPLPTRLTEPITELVAWRTGWVVAVAASIFAILSLTIMPSRERLAWDLYKGGAMAQLSIKMGE